MNDNNLLIFGKNICNKKVNSNKLTFYEEKNLVILNGLWFTLLSTKSGLIADSTYLIEDKWLLHAEKMQGCSYLKGNYILMGNAGGNNYYHWLFQSYGSLLVSIASGIDLKNHTVLGSRLNNWKKQYLELIPGLKYQEIKTDNTVIVENIYFNNILWKDFVYNPSTLVLKEFDKIKSYEKSNIKKIYISRCDTKYRKVENEKELVDMLKKYDFQKVILSEYSVVQQISLFRNASEIISPHGAGLTNLIFSSENTSVIELFQEGYINKCFLAIAISKKMKYIGLVNPIRDIAVNHHASNMCVNIEKLKLLLEK
jgi:capsular polysaccharide biosynthesis protein